MRYLLVLIGAASLVLAPVVAPAQVRAPAPVPGPPTARPGQTPAAPTPGAPVVAAGKTRTDPQVTLIGCVESEAGYRDRLAAGAGGVLGTGIDAGDELVLTHVRPAPAAIGTTGAGETQNRARPAEKSDSIPAPQANSRTGGGVYTLTGPLEDDLTRDVGRQVTIVGTIENAGERSTGADLTDVSDLPRIVVKSWQRTGEACPAR